MNWMDGELCGNGPEHCNMNPAYISNWTLTSNTGPAPGPAPSPAPPAGQGMCCWGPDCSGCQADSENWCSQSAHNCQVCGGTWCQGQHAGATPTIRSQAMGCTCALAVCPSPWPRSLSTTA